MEEELAKVGNFGLSETLAYKQYKYARHITSKKLYAYRELSIDEKSDNFEQFTKIKNNNVLSFQKEGDLIFWEYLNGGNLENFNKHLSFRSNNLNEIQIQKIVNQIINGLECLQKNEKIYGGITLNNIFIEFENKEEALIGNNFNRFTKYYNEFIENEDLVSYNIKLQYFISFHDRKRAIESGADNNSNDTSKYYISPEILNELDNNYNPFAANIWSLGVITYRLLTGKEYPFKGDNIREIIDNIKNERILIPSDLCPSLQIIRFITCLLKYQPDERPSLEKIKKLEFLKGNPLNFDFINTNLLLENEKYLTLNLKENDPIKTYLYNTNLENRIKKSEIDEAEILNINETIKAFEEKVKELETDFKKIKNPKQYDIDYYITNINGIKEAINALKEKSKKLYLNKQSMIN